MKIFALTAVLTFAAAAAHAALSSSPSRPPAIPCSAATAAVPPGAGADSVPVAAPMVASACVLRFCMWFVDGGCSCDLVDCNGRLVCGIPANPPPAAAPPLSVLDPVLPATPGPSSPPPAAAATTTCVQRCQGSDDLSCCLWHCHPVGLNPC
jgi:hypothetical protein